jgi:hypothetical protein
MSFEALKQYFRSRHGKTSYTEEEPSTLFFSKDGESRNYKLLILTRTLLYCTVCTGTLPYISGGQLTHAALSVKGMHKPLYAKITPHSYPAS